MPFVRQFVLYFLSEVSVLGLLFAVWRVSVIISDNVVYNKLPFFLSLFVLSNFAHSEPIPGIACSLSIPLFVPPHTTGQNPLYYMHILCTFEWVCAILDIYMYVHVYYVYTYDMCILRLVMQASV